MSSSMRISNEVKERMYKWKHTLAANNAEEIIRGMCVVLEALGQNEVRKKFKKLNLTPQKS